MTPDSSSSDEIRRFEEQYESQPDSLVFARLADAYRKAGKPERALSILEDGLTRHPDYPSGHIVHARTLRDLGRMEDTLDSFRRALELDASNLVAMRELAGLAEERGDTEEARHWYERLSQIEPANAEYLSKLTLLESVAASEDPDSNSGIRLDEPSGSSEWWDDSAVTLDPDSASWDLPDGGRADSDGEGESEGDPGEPAAVDDPLADVPVLDIPDPIGLEMPPEEEIPEQQRPEDEAVEAILNGDVPHTVKAEDTWWYEEAPSSAEPEPSKDADLLTRTMADLYAEQGLHAEAAEIYRELLEATPDDPGLLERLESVRQKLRAPETARETASDLDSDPPAEPEDLAVPPPIGPPAGRPVADELRRLLRRGEERAAELPDPEPTGSDASEEAAVPDRAPEGETLPEPELTDAEATTSPEGNGPALGDFAREWLRGLESGS
jgi:tetratricopeptide (TPR) repeat protein